MKLQRFEVSEAPRLTVVCHGDLDVNGGRPGEVAIKAYGGDEDLQVAQEGDNLTITSRARCKIACPLETTLTVQAVHGDLRVRGLEGAVTIDNAHGDALFKDVGATSASVIAGDARVRSVNGDLKLERVGGDLSVRGIEGMLSCDNVGGDLNASFLEGGLQASVGGDGSIKSDFAPGSESRLTTGGDVSIKFPTNANVAFQVNAGGDISHKVDWTRVTEEGKALAGQVGDGEARVTINAGGDVSLRAHSDAGAFVFGFVAEDEGLELELESMAEEIERNIQAHMARLNAELEEKLSRIDHDAIRRKAEQAASKVRRKAERAAERARLKADRAQRRWERMEPRRPARPAPPPSPPRGIDPVSDDERLMILRMVQEGKINTDEAAKLLEAMEG
jgi:hypothetical protein